MEDGIYIILVMCLIGVVFAFVSWIAYDAGYENGQIDYANNEIYYELEKQEDNTTDWIYCKEGC